MTAAPDIYFAMMRLVNEWSSSGDRSDVAACEQLSEACVEWADKREDEDQLRERLTQLARVWESVGYEDWYVCHALRLREELVPTSSAP